MTRLHLTLRARSLHASPLSPSRLARSIEECADSITTDLGETTSSTDRTASTAATGCRRRCPPRQMRCCCDFYREVRSSPCSRE